MRKLIVSILFVVPIAVAAQKDCSQRQHPYPLLNDSVKKVFEKNLADAYSNYRNDSTNAENIIWYGRRAAYVGDYHKAIDIFTRGMRLFPSDARFRRHRGHRYITLRCFEKATDDFKTASLLIADRVDEVEPDGLPNAKNIPTSTLHSNTWYHLGLAHYLQGDYREALEAYEQCLLVSDNNDMYIATLNWLYITLRKLGKHVEAEQRLKNINPDMEIIENKDYLEILLMYKTKDPSKLEARTKSQESLSNATLGFGLGNYYLLRGQKNKAKEIFQRVVKGNQWSSFGFIAAERELNKLR
jgi:tetratricopeptide (TPR) repeat protein